MQAKPFRGVVRENDPIVEFQRLVQNVPKKIRVHPEIDDDFIRRLRNAADICVAGLEAGCVNSRSRGRVGFAHNRLREGQK